MNAKIEQSIDAQLAAIYAPAAQIISTIESLQEQLKYARTEATKAAWNAKLDAAREELKALDEKAAPLEAVYAAHRWSRFFLVPGGHLHSSRSCSSFRWNTVTAWMPEYSGHDEAGVVGLAGEAACTICFPSAPVNRPSMLPVHVAEREAAAAEKAERSAKQAKAAAEAIKVGRTTYKTLRAAENAISWEMESYVSRSYQNGVDEEHTTHLRNLAAEDRGTIYAIADAIEAVYPEWDRAGVLAKKFTTKAKEYRKAGFAIPADATF